MSTRLPLRAALIVLLACTIAYLVYARYQRSNTEQQRLRQDAGRIETMLTENNAQQP